MSLHFNDEQLAELRHCAQQLIKRSGEHEDQLETLVASAEGDVQHADAAFSQATDSDANQLRELFSAQVQRSGAGAAAVRRLCVTARQQHAVARQLLTRLGVDRSAGEKYPHAVLVVDDYGDVRDAVAFVLQDAGFVVRTAANGLEALIAAYEMRPGVIVMDVSMPVLDGIEATRLIKASQATRDARVIAYTGNASFDDSLTQTLFAAVLRKSAPLHVVLATVQHVAGQ